MVYDKWCSFVSDVLGNVNKDAWYILLQVRRETSTNVVRVKSVVIFARVYYTMNDREKLCNRTQILQQVLRVLVPSDVCLPLHTSPAYSKAFDGLCQWYIWLIGVLTQSAETWQSCQYWCKFPESFLLRSRIIQLSKPIVWNALASIWYNSLSKCDKPRHC